tara:strand:- start:1012 stop:1788 length:777 start_codon:yes stop_codon:yes gene_type:complete
MSNVCFIGCSWVRGYNISDNETLPYLYSEKHPNLNVINAGQNAKSIFYYKHILKEILNYKTIDKVFIGLTTFDRDYVGIDGFIDAKKHNKVNFEELTKNYEIVWDMMENNFDLTPGLAWTSNAQTKPDFYEITKDEEDYLHKQFRFVQEHNYKLKYNDFTSFLRFWGEYISNSTLQKEKYNFEILLLDNYCKQNNIEVSFYRWLDTIEIEDWVLNSDAHIYNQTVESYVNDKNLYIDNGYHFNKIGNKKVVEFLDETN